MGIENIESLKPGDDGESMNVKTHTERPHDIGWDLDKVYEDLSAIWCRKCRQYITKEQANQECPKYGS